MTETATSPRDVVAWFLRQLAEDPEAGRIARRMPALLGTRGAGVCDCDGADSPPTDWLDRSLPLLHHCDCVAWVVAETLARTYADREGFQPEWAAR
jgi:hypothetical protein